MDLIYVRFPCLITGAIFLMNGYLWIGGALIITWLVLGLSEFLNKN
jgi:hypothetical protein